MTTPLATPTKSYAALLDELDSAEDQIAAQRAEAFAAENGQWNGRPLQPFSISREAMFYSLRVSAGHPPLSAVVKNMEAFVADALIILWLCDHTPDHWAAMRSDPPAMLADIDAWADRHVTPDQLAEARILALQILNRSQINRAQAAPVQTPGRPVTSGN